TATSRGRTARRRSRARSSPRPGSTCSPSTSSTTQPRASSRTRSAGTRRAWTSRATSSRGTRSRAGARDDGRAGFGRIPPGERRARLVSAGPTPARRRLAVSAFERPEFRALFDEQRDPLFRFLLRLTRNASDAEDLLQETFLTVWKKRELFDGRGSAAGFLR